MADSTFSKLTMAERQGVLKLAELRVRAGETPIAVRTALGIPESTFVRAAARGFWRLKDLQREEEGLEPLPLAHFARPGCGKPAPADRLADAEDDDTGAGRSDPQKLSELIERAEATGLQALTYFRSGHTKKAEDKLKEAERLARLHRRLLAHVPPEPTAAELQRQRVAAMTKPELIAEIKRRAGLE